MAYQHPVTKKFMSKAAYEALMNQQTVKVDLPALIANVPSNDVDAMVRRVNLALDARERFERSKQPNGSHIELRRVKGWMRSNRRLAAFLVVCGADPSQMLNRERKAGYRANLKGFQKVKRLLDYVTLRSRTFERVSLALFASSIIASNRGVGWISSQEQELILSSLPVGSLPQEVQEAIKEYQHRFMRIEGDSRNQACQFRTTFDNLGLYFFSREDQDEGNHLGINVNMESPVIQYLNQRWELDKVS